MEEADLKPHGRSQVSRFGSNVGEFIERRTMGCLKLFLREIWWQASSRKTFAQVSFKCLKLILNGLTMSARRHCERGTDMCCCECDEFWENITAASEGKLTERRIWSKGHFHKMACCVATRIYITTRRPRANPSESVL